MKIRLAWLAPLAPLAALVMVGCPGVETPPAPDSGPDLDGAPRDAPPPTDAPSCEVATDCDDGIYCNGPESCTASACRAGTPPCAAAACDEAADSCSCAEPDMDGDGVESMACGGTDCDDSDPDRAPGLAEVCDAATLDEDCDPTTFGARDGDGDTHVDSACCNLDGTGGMACGDDCDDSRADVFAGTTEVCDGIDNDCNAAIDEGVSRTLYRDLDLDLHGDPSMPTLAGCTLPPGYVENGDDCDDARSDRNPTTVEACDGVDNDCDSMIDEGIGSVYHLDSDGDGFGAMTGSTVTACSTPPGHSDNSTDCDDTNRLVNPATTELCDGLDNNCSGTIDESGPRTFYRDFDGDGSGDTGEVAMTTSCTPPPGYVATPDDCNDRNVAVHAGATEVCNGLDDDCSRGVTGGGLDPSEDTDGDMHTPAGHACAGGPFPEDDCNDTLATIHGGAAEVCDGLDDDCSTGGGTLPSEDGDGDMHAAAGAACTGGFPRDDCNDADGTIHGGAMETCDRIDSNCSSGGGVELAEDLDGDMHASLTAACVGGFPRDDCSDSSASIYLGATELCDRLDTDCSSGGGLLLGEDADNDGHSSTTAACVGGFERDDCNDGDPSVRPGATERCNRLDDDCSAGGGVDATEDADADGFAPVGAACTGGFLRTDCDDFDPAIRPGVTEICNRIDDDCSSGGGVLASEDADSDGFAPIGALCSTGFPRTDCADTNASIHPGAAELCDGLDDDCSSGGGPVGGEDNDGDMHAPIGALCSGGYPRDDCSDVVATTHPGAAEVCNRIDDDCSSGGGVLTSEDADSDMHAAIDAACTGGLPRDDCDDAVDTTHPGAPETCNRVDDDCSSGGGMLLAEDGDNDAHSPATAACTGGYPKNDCDDTNRNVYGGAVERCDRLDSDCSSGGGALPAEDVDNDMHSPVSATCTPGGGAFLADDCNDTNATVYPGAIELCDRVDNNCSTGGASDPAEDFDDDMHTPTGASCIGGPLPADDCMDDDATVYPGAPVTTPVPVRWESGALTGSSLAPAARDTLRPRFDWVRRGDCASTFDIQIDDTCSTPGFAACTMPSPAASGASLTTTTFQPASDLPVSAAYPVGRRYYWRVRACTGGTCSAYSAVRYLDVGRTRSDFTGDGYGDLASGAYRADEPEGNEGNILVQLASASGLGSGLVVDSPLDEAGAEFGTALTTGDLNGDGSADLVVGAPLADRGSTDRGVAFVYYGGAFGLGAVPSSTLDSPSGQANGGFAAALSAGGDVNGDGYADLIVGAPMYDGAATDRGRVYVYYGAAGGIATTPSETLDSSVDQANANFGAVVAAIGDVNADGIADLAIGAPMHDRFATNDGRVEVYYGSTAGLSAAPDLVLDGSGDGANFGSSIAGGDFDGRGIGDVAIGAPGGATGRVLVHAGTITGLAVASSAHTSAASPELTAAFGRVLAAADIDLDGDADLMVGAPYQNGASFNDTGSVFVFHGGAAGLPSTATTRLDDPAPDAAGMYFGSAVAAVDVDVDGFMDVFVGAPGQPGNAGRVFGYDAGPAGLSTSPAWTYMFGLGPGNASFGNALAWLRVPRHRAPLLLWPRAG